LAGVGWLVLVGWCWLMAFLGLGVICPLPPLQPVCPVHLYVQVDICHFSFGQYSFAVLAMNNGIMQDSCTTMRTAN